MIFKVVCVAFASVLLAQANPISNSFPAADFVNDPQITDPVSKSPGSSNNGKTILSYDEVNESDVEDYIGENLEDLGTAGDGDKDNIDQTVNKKKIPTTIPTQDDLVNGGNGNEFSIVHNKPESTDVSNRFPELNAGTTTTTTTTERNTEDDEFPIIYDNPEKNDDNNGNILPTDIVEPENHNESPVAPPENEQQQQQPSEDKKKNKWGGFLGKVNDAFQATVNETNKKVSEGIESVVGTGQQFFDAGKKVADAGITLGTSIPRFGKKIFS